MSIKIKDMRSNLESCKNSKEYEALRDKIHYAMAKESGTIENFKRREISRRVQQKYPLDRQIEILLSGDQAEITLLKSYRAMISAEVDHYIKQVESELSNGN